MSIRRTESLWLAVCLLLISSSGFSQTRAPLPPEAEQLSAWKVSYPEWFHNWETAEMRCNIDDPTLFRLVRLDEDIDPNAEIQTASEQIEELDLRIVRDLQKRGWSRMNQTIQATEADAFRGAVLSCKSPTDVRPVLARYTTRLP